jgi:hypothetical protein
VDFAAALLIVPPAESNSHVISAAPNDSSRGSIRRETRATPSSFVLYILPGLLETRQRFAE